MINLGDMAAYIAALSIAVAVPGPGITALVARSVGSGARSGFAMLGGIIVGDLLYLSFAVFGLVLVAQHFNAIFTFFRWAAIVYLLYLAWQFWSAERHEMDTANSPSRRNLGAAAASGLAITLANPKTIAFYLALLPLLLQLDAITVGTWASVLVPLTIAVLLVVGSVFVLGAIAVRELLTGPRAQKHLHRGAAVAMAGAAGTMKLREL